MPQPHITDVEMILGFPLTITWCSRSCGSWQIGTGSARYPSLAHGCPGSPHHCLWSVIIVSWRKSLQIILSWLASIVCLWTFSAQSGVKVSCERCLHKSNVDEWVKAIKNTKESVSFDGHRKFLPYCPSILLNHLSLLLPSKECSTNQNSFRWVSRSLFFCPTSPFPIGTVVHLDNFNHILLFLPLLFSLFCFFTDLYCFQFFPHTHTLNAVLWRSWEDKKSLCLSEHRKTVLSNFLLWRKKIFSFQKICVLITPWCFLDDFSSPWIKGKKTCVVYFQQLQWFYNVYEI